VRNKYLFIAVVSTLLVALVVSGCVGPAEPGETKEEPIKVGGLIPVTGPFASDGKTWSTGMTMAVAELNKQGGLLGRPVELDVFDIEDMMAEKLTAATEKLVGRDKVDLLATIYAGFGPDVVACGKYDVPFIHQDANEMVANMVKDNWPQYSNVFMTAWVEEEYGKDNWRMIKRLPYEFPNNKIARLSGDFDWDLLSTEGVCAEAEKEGWERVVDETFSYGVREWGPILTKIRQEDPSLIIFGSLDAGDMLTFFRQWNEEPTNSLIDFGYGFEIPALLDMLGDEGNGVLGYALTRELPYGRGAEWAELYREEYEMDLWGSRRATIPASVSVSYDTIMIWADAVKAVGDPTDYVAICDYLRESDNVCVEGEFHFDEYGLLEVGPHMPLHYQQWQDGKGERLFLTDQEGYIGDATFQTPSWLEE